MWVRVPPPAFAGVAAPRRRLRLAPLAAALVGAVAAMVAGGCVKPLFDPNEERTQYDRYDRARGDLADQYIQDALGRKTPNLRERLSKER